MGRIAGPSMTVLEVASLQILVSRTWTTLCEVRWQVCKHGSIPTYLPRHLGTYSCLPLIVRPCPAVSG